ncbi:MAG TPA: DNA-deoxyinosine glycosylase [Sphingomonadaceae bacterium]|nr:DNA-deoxyinosine glycosylase [Sphingomonadaceae bacterium]
MDAGPKYSFPPVADGRTRVLVLGSLPGEVSLRRAQYYGHPRNLFWPLMEELTGRNLVSLAYEERLSRLLDTGVGLWDVVGSARRQGSLDVAMWDVHANDLADLVAHLPKLRAIGFNGGTSARIGRAQLAGSSLALIDLPSSSPAYASLPFAAKLERWRELARFL